MLRTKMKHVDEAFNTADREFEREIPLGLKSGGLVTVEELKSGKKLKKKKSKAKLNAHSLSFDMEDEGEDGTDELPSPSPTKKQKSQ